MGSRCCFSLVQRRCLHLHEFQSMQLMQKYGVALPCFGVAKTPAEAMSATKLIPGNDYVIKAQVLSGGRGLGYFAENGFRGGVQVCASAKEAGAISEKMLGQTLITKQTGIEGKPCNSVLVAERFYIRREKYMAIMIDRVSGGPLLLGSSVGGTSIEDIAEQNPSAMISMPVDAFDGLSDETARTFVERLGFCFKTGADAANDALATVKGLYKMFLEKDCLMLEVNPLAETSTGRVYAVDAKITFDDNAEFRQKDLFIQKDESQLDPREAVAERFGLNYVGLDGNIGCVVNGAGLAMATMDIIQLHGGKPANFLDLGGTAGGTQVIEALRILQNDNKVSAIFINIFGGIMRCDIIANGLIEASKEAGLEKPLVIRLEGTNRDEAKKILAASDLKYVFESDFTEAAKKVVNISNISNLATEANLKVHFNR